MRCNAITEARFECNRIAELKSDFCWQHLEYKRNSYTLDDIHSMETYNDKIQDQIDTVQTEIYSSAYSSSNYKLNLDKMKNLRLQKNYITIESLILNNSTGKREQKIEDEYFLRYDIDKRLAEHFLILGQGTQSLVFDVGTFVLKRVESQNRGTWEIDLNIKFGQVKAETYNLYLDYNNDWGIYFLAQEKMEIIDPKKYKSKIIELYFPEVSINSDFFLFWEWGIDKNNIPRVIDWG
jgi:hypothetical protein